MKKELTLYWEGKVSYGFSYWVWLTLIGTIISLPAFLPDAYWDAYAMPMLLYVVFLFAGKIFLIVGTWRSAEKYKMQKQKKKLSAFWAYVGQASIILSIISTAAELI
ncbi:hypothetical protein N9A34_00405 [Candidatus Pelagibacter sp.]|nr:hypothetical protein [Candidatus Pelagibacter sp.]